MVLRLRQLNQIAAGIVEYDSPDRPRLFGLTTKYHALLFHASVVFLDIGNRK